MGKIKGSIAVASLVCGVLGLLILVTDYILDNSGYISNALSEALGKVGALMFLLAIVLGVVSLTLPKRTHAPRNRELGGVSLTQPERTHAPHNREIAIAGIILGVIFFAIIAITIICAVLFFIRD